MRRRTLLIALPVLLLPGVSHAAGPNLLAILDQAVEAVGEIGDIIPKTTKNGLVTWDLGAGRLHRAHYQDISSQIASAYSGNQGVLGAIDIYFRKWKAAGGRPEPQGRGVAAAKLSDDWHQVQNAVFGNLQQIGFLLTTLTSEHGQLSSQDSVLELRDALSGKSAALTEIFQMETPATPAEIADLKDVESRFVQLREKLRLSAEQLNAYVRRL